MNYFLYSFSADSVKLFPEITITSEKEYQNSFKNKRNVKKIQIDTLSFVPIDKFLNLMNNVTIKDLGGMGSIKTVSIRGMSANQTAILIDDVPINNSTNGIVDLSTLSLNLFENVEIIKSGDNNNLLNSGINLTTINNQNKISASVQIGSFGQYQLSGKFTKSNFLNFTFDLLKYKGEFDYQNEINGKKIDLLRSNTDLLLFNSLIGLKINSENDLKIIYKYNSKNIPKAVISNVIDNKLSFLTENDLLVNFKSSFNDKFKNVTSLKFNYLEYQDSSGFAKLIENKDVKYITKSIINTIFYENGDDKYLLQSDFNIDFSDLRGDMLDPNVRKYINRTKIDLNSVFNYYLFKSDLENLSIAFKYGAILNKDYLKTFEFFNNGSIFLIYRNIEKQFDIKANIFKTSRLPNFNEMYYLNYGNSNLKPENSLNFDINFNKYFEYFDLSISTYLILVNNQIISVPTSPISWTASNIGKTKNYGLELSSNLFLFKKSIIFNFEYNIQFSKDDDKNSFNYGKIIPYVPQEKISSSFKYIYSNFVMNLFFQYYSFRYSLADNSFNSLIPSYYIFDSQICYKFNLNQNNKLILNLNIDNILNKSYEIIKNYPLPRRTFKLGLNYEII